VITPAITAWIRYVVDPAAPPSYGFIRWRRPEWVFFGRLIQIWLFTGMAAALPLLPLVALAGFDTAAVEGMGSVPLVVAGIASAVLSLLTMVSFGLSAPAAAIGAPSDLRLAFRAVAGRRWHILGAIILSSLAAMAVLIVFSVIGGSIAIVFTAAAGQGAALYVGVLTGGLLVLPAYFLIYGVAATLAGIYYRWLVNHELAEDGAMSRVRPAGEFG
jgi:hypothetical protein